MTTRPLVIVNLSLEFFWISESDDVQPRDMPIWSMRHQALRSTPVVILGTPIPIIQFWPYTWPWINKVIKSGHWSSETPDHLLNVTCLCVLQSVSYVAIDVQICTITSQFTSMGQRELLYLQLLHEVLKWKMLFKYKEIRLCGNKRHYRNQSSGRLVFKLNGF